MEKPLKQKSFLPRIAFFVICAMLILLIINRNMSINSLKKEWQELDRQLSEADREIERLESEFEKPITDEMMRQLARDNLGFYQSDEIIYEVS